MSCIQSIPGPVMAVVGIFLFLSYIYVNHIICDDLKKFSDGPYTCISYYAFASWSLYVLLLGAWVAG